MKSTPKIIFAILAILLISSGVGMLSAYAYTSGIPIPPKLPAPTGLKGINASPNSVQLSWNVVKNATSYTVVRSTSATVGFIKIGTTSTTSFLDTTATPVPNVTGYYYQVAAYNSKLGYGNPAQLLVPTHYYSPPPNPACQQVKTILSSAQYSSTIITKVMADMNCP